MEVGSCSLSVPLLPPVVKVGLKVDKFPDGVGNPLIEADTGRDGMSELDSASLALLEVRGTYTPLLKLNKGTLVVVGKSSVPVRGRSERVFWVVALVGTGISPEAAVPNPPDETYDETMTVEDSVSKGVLGVVALVNDGATPEAAVPNPPDEAYDETMTVEDSVDTMV